jgi:hypothetical protein
MQRNPTIRPLLMACLLAAAATLPAAESAAPGPEELAGQAKAAVKDLATSLKSELIVAMEAGGAVQAIEVCHSRAPAIAADISERQGLEVYRVSQRNRNPDNAPADWQSAVLEDFEARLEAGEDPDSVAWQEVAEMEGGREYRFMKAIPTGGLCLQCHGNAIAPDVAARISELYPDDRAIGFEPGDLRGAFVVTKDLD